MSRKSKQDDANYFQGWLATLTELSLVEQKFEGVVRFIRDIDTWVLENHPEIYPELDKFAGEWIKENVHETEAGKDDYLKENES